MEPDTTHFRVKGIGALHRAIMPAWSGSQFLACHAPNATAHHRSGESAIEFVIMKEGLILRYALEDSINPNSI